MKSAGMITQSALIYLLVCDHERKLKMEINFTTAFYLLIAFILSRWSKIKIYIGYDEKKYQKADFAIKLRH